jgi:hypothetical protein
MRRLLNRLWSGSASTYMVAPDANRPPANTLKRLAAVICSSGPGKDQVSRVSLAATGHCGGRRAYEGSGHRRLISASPVRGKRYAPASATASASASASTRTPRIPARITIRRLLATAAAVCTTAAAGTLGTACAASAPGLCQMNTSRGAVAGNFPIVACVDGTNIWLSNTSTHVLSVTGSGDIETAYMMPTDPSFAVSATRKVTGILYRDELILLPGDKIQVPIGSGAAEVRVSVFGPADVFYTLADIVATSVPRLARADTFTQFAMAITADFNSYGSCKKGRNFLGQALCFARFTIDITKAVTYLQLGINTPSVLGVLLASNTFIEWTASAAGDQAVPASAIDQAQRQ